MGPVLTVAKNVPSVLFVVFPAWGRHIVERGCSSSPFTQSTARGQTISSLRLHLLPSCGVTAVMIRPILASYDRFRRGGD